MTDECRILKEYFGHDSFRNGQEQIVDAILSGRDALCVMPTGAGKSVCYQVPALMFDGVTIVVSPLISLMKDQVSALVQSGIAGAYINSSLTFRQYLKVLQNIVIGKYKIIYVAPERLASEDFLDVCKKIKISLVAVDESHCISQWGQDFRPSYLKITEFVDSLPNRPIIGAFTATATDEVKTDIKEILQLNDPFTITTGFDRPNLFFGVERPERKLTRLFELVKERPGKSGIVYCATRKSVESVCEALNLRGFSATRYHAGLDEIERNKNQEDFVFDRKMIMVATNAFGMGIDKSNVSYVIHYNMPKNIESYYQEAGRAGRDGSDADCILLYSPSDVRTNQFLIDVSEPNPELTEDEQDLIRKRDLERLKYMTFYCTATDCLRHYILYYFGEHGKTYCGNCSSCLSNYETADITVDAQKILSCIAKTGQRFGRKTIIDILRGSKNEKLLSRGLQKQSTYGIMTEQSEKRVRDTVTFLTEKGYIEAIDSEYPVLKLTPQSYEILRGDVTLKMKVLKEQRAKEKTELPVNEPLLEALKALRKKLAARQSVPAFVIFTDATLIDMCKKRPRTAEEFLNVSGVGAAKLQKYGKAFLDVIEEAEKPIKDNDNVSKNL